MLAGAAYWEKVTKFGWQDKHLMISATRASMLWMSGTGHAYIYCLLPLFSSIAYADQYYREHSVHSVAAILLRQTRERYYYSKLIVTSISGFVFSIFPLLLNLLLCIIAFPLKPTTAFATGSVYSTPFTRELQWVLFPNLYMNYPVLNTLTHILLIGLFGSNIACLSYTLTLHYRKNAITAVCATTMLYLLYNVGASTMRLYIYTPFHFFLTAPEGYTKNIVIFFIILLIIAIFNIILFGVKLLKNKDVIA